VIGKEEIEHRFGHHKATVEGPEATMPKHVEMREYFKGMALYLDMKLPDSREKSLVFTKLEEASMYSHKAIAKTAPLVEEHP
jgi:hypothetical protein